MLAAARRGDLKEIKKLLGEGVKINEPDKDGWTALHYAANKGHEAATQELLKNGANPNARSHALDTPMHLAAENGHEGAVRALLEGGADSSMKNDDGETPLDMAREAMHSRVAAMLQNPADVHPSGAKTVPAISLQNALFDSTGKKPPQSSTPHPSAASRPAKDWDSPRSAPPKESSSMARELREAKEEVSQLAKELRLSELKRKDQLSEVASKKQVEMELNEVRSELRVLERERKQQRQKDSMERGRMEDEISALKEELSRCERDRSRVKQAMEDMRAQHEKEAAAKEPDANPRQQMKEKRMEKEMEGLKKQIAENAKLEQHRKRVMEEKHKLEKENATLKQEIKDLKDAKAKETEGVSRMAPIQQFSLDQIKDATERFSKKNRLGAGSFGSVYQGHLVGMPVAIKRIDDPSMQGLEDLHLEVDVLGSFNHRHVVQLTGWCPEGRCLVTELCERGSLEDNLPSLVWHERIRVGLEVARALLFLHLRRPEAVVHRDLKPANVLVDRYGTAKLADVGLAKMMPNPGMTQNATHANTQILAGTYAYMDPEYIQMGEVAPGSDVYSFGVMMLEMLTGRSPVSNRLPDLVEDALKGNRIAKITDSAAGDWPEASARAWAVLGLQCIEPRRRRRPPLETKVLPELERLYDESQSSVSADAVTNLQADVNRVQLNETKLCAVCKTDPPTHAILPCLHRCICEKCGPKVLKESKRCPVCLQRAEDCRQVLD